jgi:DNA-directed RNA polymerase subunit omega
MLKPPINELIEIVGSRYALVMGVSKRARNIIDGAQRQTKNGKNKPVSIAVNELYEGKIECIPYVESEDEE